MKQTQLGRWLILGAGVLLFVGCSPAARQTRHLERAERYLALEAYDEAIIEFTNVLRADPTNAVANRMLGETYLRTGNPVPAYIYLRRAAEVSPQDSEVQIKLGQLYVMGNEPLKAWELGQSVLAREPENFDALVLLVDSARDTNQLQEVQQRLEATRSLFGNKVNFHVAEGSLWTRQGNLAAAEKSFQTAVASDPKAPMGYMALGALYQEQRKLAEAVAAYQSAAELSPTNSIARIRWAEARYQLGERAPGRETAEDLVTHFPNFAPGRTIAGQLALSDRDIPTAQKHVDALLKLRPDHFEGLMLKSRLLLAAHKPKEALPILQGLVRRAPNLAEGHMLLGTTYSLERNFDDAMRELKAALTLKPNLIGARLLLSELYILRGNPVEAIGLLEPLLKNKRLPSRAYVLLGTAYRMEGRMEDATATLRELVATAPNNAQGQYMLGTVLRQQNRPDEAAEAFENSLITSPEYVMAAAQLAAIQIQKKDLQGAIERLQQQIERATNAPGLPFLLGTIYRRQGETNLAVAAYQQAIERAPAFSGAYVELSTLYAASGKPAEALAQLEKSLEQNPKHLPSLMLAAKLRQDAGDMKGARTDYEAILKLAPKYVPALNNLAYLLNETFNDLDGAFALATQAREVLPKDPFTADTLGWIVYKRGDYRWSASLLRESLAAFKRQPEVQYHLACALLAMGSEEEANSLLKDAIATPEPFTGRDDAERLVTMLKMDPTGISDRVELEKMQKTLRDLAPTPTILCRLGLVAEQLEGPAAGLEDYEAALRANAKFMPALLGAARANLALGHADKARELATAARDLSPQNPDALSLLGRIAYTQGQHAWAFSVLQEAATKRPQDASLQLEMGLAAFAVARLDEAQKAFAQAQQLDASAGTINQKATLCLALMPDAIRKLPADDARTKVEAALREWPDCLPALAAQAEVELRAGDLAAADASLAKLNSQVPTYTPAIVARLMLLADRHDGSAEALKLVTLGREQAPENSDLAEASGRVCYWGEKYDLSASTLKRLRASGRTLTPESLYCLGLSLVQTGATSEGTSILTEALAAAPDHVLASKAREAMPDDSKSK